MSHPRNSHLLLIAILLVLVLLACNLSTNVSTPTETSTPPPLYQQVVLTFVPFSESGTGPDYTISALTPLLQGSVDSRVLAFNQAMAALVQQEMDAFRQNLLMLPAEPITGGSSLNITFEKTSPPGYLLSLKFTVDFYSDGAAHPGSYSHTATYDLEAGSFLTLDQLFTPGADYLGAIATFCKAELAARDIAYDPSMNTGADPIPENYQNWNITAGGLLITFDEYQVAAYAAGPQLVTIPYANLQSIIAPQGPLAEYLP
jgi:Protein of unknown function (DUF3298)